ncbi:MAG: FtsX-like permease family protein [Angelakisella sp.]
MRISDIIAICWRNLTRRKLRTALTAFGVVIGVCAIIVMMSIGIGLEQSFTAQLEQWGDLTMITINNYGGTATLDDAAVLKIQGFDGVEIATPFYQPDNLQLMVRAKNGRYEAWPQLYGVYPEALEKMGFELSEGSYLKAGDKEYSVVVGANFAYRFRDTKKKHGRGDRVDQNPDPVTGKIKPPFVNLKKDKILLVADPRKEGVKPMELKPVFVGTLKQNDQNWETSEGLFMDINELKAITKKYNKLNGLSKTDKIKYQEVRVKCNSMDEVSAVQAKIKEMGFECYSMEDSRKSMQDTARMIQMVLGGLAAISLFVAAIGIANTMVMSIIERTREIGIMKVIGAEIGNIRVMFLMESGMIGFMGGIMGVALSYGVSYLINMFAGGGGSGGGMMGMFGGMGGATKISVIPLWLVGFALFFSIVIGIVFGFLPANRAVKISALEAIKHD